MSATQYIERLFGDLPALFKNEGELRELWSMPDTRKKLLNALSEMGYNIKQLTDIRRIIDAEKSDLYDVLAYIAFAHAPISREERVSTHKNLILSHYEDKQQEFIEFVLSHYIEHGVGELDQDKLPHLLELKYQAVTDSYPELGNLTVIREMFYGFQRHLYTYQAVA